MTTTAPLTISLCKPEVRGLSFIEIDVRDLPVLWEDIFRQAINDYISGNENDDTYKNAEEWLFHEDYDSELDGKKSLDICSFYVVAEAFYLDIEKVRFHLQCIRDLCYREKNTKRKKVISLRRRKFLLDLTEEERGRRLGYVTHNKLGRLIKIWRKED